MALSTMKFFSFLDLSELSKEYFGGEFLKDVAVIRSRMREMHESLVFLEELHPVLCDKLGIVRELMHEEARDVRFKYLHVKILLKRLDPDSDPCDVVVKGQKINKGRIFVIKMLRASFREIENRFRSFAQGILVKDREAREAGKYSKYIYLSRNASSAIEIMDSRKYELQVVPMYIDKYEELLKERKESRNFSIAREMMIDHVLKVIEIYDFFLPGVAGCSHLIISSNRFAEHKKRVQYYKNCVARINRAVTSNRFAKCAKYDIFVKCLAAVGDMYVTLFDWGEPVSEWALS